MPTLNNYSKILDSLLSLQSNLDEAGMIEIFGQHIGEHLFEKLIRLDRNIVYFYSGLDKYNRIIFVKHLSRLSCGS
jgi:hypothetical protein